MNLITQETQPPSEDYRIIPLTRGKVTMVSNEDYAGLSQHRWHAWRNSSSGQFYARRSVGGTKNRGIVYMHREILGLSTGDAREGDHISPTDTLDNRRSNLRIASHAENMRNSRKKRGPYLKGVWLWPRPNLKRPWRATIQGEFIGLFFTEAEAHEAYKRAAIDRFGEFARFQ